MYNFQEHRARIALLRAECARTQRRIKFFTGALGAVLGVALLLSITGAIVTARLSNELKTSSRRLSYN